MKEIIINHFLNYEFVYIFLFCFLVFLLLSMFIKQKTTRKISILLSSLFIVLFGFELYLSFVIPLGNNKHATSYTTAYDTNNISKIRSVNILLSNGETYKTFNDNIDFDLFDNYTLIFDATYSLYDNSFRATKCNSFAQETYIFLGCSFTFGIGVNDDETLPYYFSKEFNFKKNIINCGVQAQSTNTALNILNNKSFAPLIKNKDSKIKHFFYSLIEHQIYRNFRYDFCESICIDGYLYKNDKWYIPTTIGKIKNLFRRSYIFQKILSSIIDDKFKQYYEKYMIKSLEQINKIIEEKYNSNLTIIVWPDDYSEYFMDNLKNTKLDLIFLPNKIDSEEDGYIIKQDSHPTAKANKEIAEILYNHINKIDILNKRK